MLQYWFPGVYRCTRQCTTFLIPLCVLSEAVYIFDYIPGEPDVRFGTAGVIGRLCVIGAGIDKEKIKELFGI